MSTWATDSGDAEWVGLRLGPAEASPIPSVLQRKTYALN